MKLFFKKWIVLLTLLCCGYSGADGAGLGAGLPGGMSLPGMEGMQDGGDSPMAGVKIGATVESYSDKPFVVVSEIKLADAWHAYFTNPGTVGLPVEAVMKPVPGFDIKGPFWAVPTRSASDLGVFYGYSSPRAAFVVTPGADAPDKVDLSVEMTWQACRDGQCLSPESKELTLSLSRGDGRESSDASSLVKGIVGLEPPVWARGLQTTCSVDGQKIFLCVKLAANVTLPEGKPVYFFSLTGEIMPTAEQVWKKNADGSYTLEMERNMNKDSLYPNSNEGEDGALLPVSSLKGVLAIDGEGVLVDAPSVSNARGEAIAEQQIPASGNSAVSPIAANARGIAAPAGEDDPGLLVICGLLFLGGLILNLMPCVFPVLGLKVLSFVQLGGGERRKVFTHALAFVVGVVASFWAITLLLIVLKSGLEGTGQTINWAFWMEEPWVIYSLMLLMLILGMSMFGIFEIGVGATAVGNDLQNRKGYAGSFWSGVLATVVATPCSAPFLGTAIAPALALPSLGMWLAFTCMGLGMAFPYVILGAFPGLVKYLPKPGAWMESFKQGLSFFLFAAAAWLLWTYMGFFTDSSLLLNAMIGLVAFCTSGWIYGRWCPMYKSKRTRLIGGAVAIIVAATGIWFSMPIHQDDASPADVPAVNVNTSEWGTWSPEAVQEALNAGHPVFVDFTARWCLTCQVNKKMAYTEDVKKMMEEYGIVLLRADKTRPNPTIDNALKELNRSSVPVNVLYVPGQPKPFITSEILTSGYLTDFFKEHLGSPEQWSSRDK